MEFVLLDRKFYVCVLLIVFCPFFSFLLVIVLSVLRSTNSDYPYIKGVGNLSSPGCSEINVMSLFNTIPRTKRSHGHKRIQHPNVKKSSKPRTLQDAFNDLLSNIQKPIGIRHIRTILFPLPVNYLKDLRDFGLDKGGVDPFSPKYRLSSIICDVASFPLFKPV